MTPHNDVNIVVPLTTRLFYPNDYTVLQVSSTKTVAAVSLSGAKRSRLILRSRWWPLNCFGDADASCSVCTEQVCQD